MNFGHALFTLLVFPGLLYAVPAAWFLLWVERKAAARMQGRIGPPFYQPFFDFIKLMDKRLLPRARLEGLMMMALPWLAAASLLGCLALLPVFPGSQGRAGDLILLAALIEIPALCAVLAGFASRSIFGQVGAVREATLMIASSLPFLIALFALAASAGSLSLDVIARQAPWGTRVLAVVALLFCLPVKLRINPFSLANAEQEIYAGAATEFEGPRLAMWELSHGLEWVALTGLVASLALPWRSGIWVADAAIFVGLSLLIALLLVLLAAGTARLKVPQAVRFYWRWGFGISILALAASVLPL